MNIKRTAEDFKNNNTVILADEAQQVGAPEEIHEFAKNVHNEKEKMMVVMSNG